MGTVIGRSLTVVVRSPKSLLDLADEIAVVLGITLRFLDLSTPKFIGECANPLCKLRLTQTDGNADGLDERGLKTFVLEIQVVTPHIEHAYHFQIELYIREKLRDLNASWALKSWGEMYPMEVGKAFLIVFPNFVNTQALAQTLSELLSISLAKELTGKYEEFPAWIANKDGLRYVLLGSNSEAPDIENQGSSLEIEIVSEYLSFTSEIELEKSLVAQLNTRFANAFTVEGWSE